VSGWLGFTGELLEEETHMSEETQAQLDQLRQEIASFSEKEL